MNKNKLYKYEVNRRFLVSDDLRQLGRRKYIFSDCSYIRWGEVFEATFQLNSNYSCILRKGEAFIPEKYRK